MLLEPQCNLENCIFFIIFFFLSCTRCKNKFQLISSRRRKGWLARLDQKLIYRCHLAVMNYGDVSQRTWQWRINNAGLFVFHPLEEKCNLIFHWLVDAAACANEYRLIRVIQLWLFSENRFFQLGSIKESVLLAFKRLLRFFCCFFYFMTKLSATINNKCSRYQRQKCVLFMSSTWSAAQYCRNTETIALTLIVYL